MATRKPAETDASLPFAALQLLAPPVRLISAALWKVMKHRDVMQYGVVEEFVTSACETVPGLLTARHQGKLALGLRGRLIMELCCKQPDEKVIAPHLERIRPPAALSVPSTMKRDVKILQTVEGFHSLVHTLLTDPAEREQFFKEEFPVDYGPVFDQELEKLLWEFLIRLDQMLPVPNLAQTVSWLSEAPPVLEECARAATQPQLLKILLQHQTCLGHLEVAASLPPNMGDSILTSLSLPPSGKVASSEPTAKEFPSDPSDSSQTREEDGPFITPVIGLMSNEDIPAMISAKKRSCRGDGVTGESLRFTAVNEKDETEEGKGSGGMKRKRPSDGSESDEEAEVLRMIRPRTKRTGKYSGASRLWQGRGEQRSGGGASLESQMAQLGVRTLPEEPSLRSAFVSCLCSQPRVVLERLSLTPAGASGSVRGGESPCAKGRNRRRRSPVKAPDSRPRKDDKENRPVRQSVSCSPSRRRRNADSLPGDSEDYVADSEDEGTKNFKGRLFMKRYYKTKHGTYVPTLREYWKPGMTRRDLLVGGSKRK